MAHTLNGRAHTPPCYKLPCRLRPLRMAPPAALRGAPAKAASQRCSNKCRSPSWVRSAAAYVPIPMLPWSLFAVECLCTRSTSACSCMGTPRWGFCQAWTSVCECCWLVVGLSFGVYSQPANIAAQAQPACYKPLSIAAARVRALEEKLPEAERRIKRYLPPGSELPSKAVGQVRHTRTHCVVLHLQMRFTAMQVCWQS